MMDINELQPEVIEFREATAEYVAAQKALVAATEAADEAAECVRLASQRRTAAEKALLSKVTK